MSYYRGDFYRGDYYRGDPGFLSFIGGLAKKAVGIGASFIPGVGGIAAKAIAGTVLPGGSGGLKGALVRAGGAIAKHPVLTAAGGAGLVGGAGAAIAGRGGISQRAFAGSVSPLGAGMRGYHISRRTGALARNRRMRVTNVRALRRAIRRCTGFAHLAKRVLRFTSPRPPRGRAVFRHRRKKKIC